MIRCGFRNSDSRIHWWGKNGVQGDQSGGYSSNAGEVGKVAEGTERRRGSQS